VRGNPISLADALGLCPPSNPDLQPIAVTATYLDPDTGLPIVGSLPSAVGGPPAANSASFDPDKANAALVASDAAYASGNKVEAARQMNTYYYYCGCSSGASYSSTDTEYSQSPPTLTAPASPPIDLPALPNIGP
jgi:hypothetical protein